MAPYAVVNPRPRRKHRRKKATRSIHRAKPRRRKHVARRRTHTYVGALKRVNPRRRRYSRRPRRHYARRRNPAFRIPFLGSVDLMEIGMTSLGFVGVNWGTPFLVGMLPPDWSQTAGAPDANKTNMVRIGAKLVTTLVPGALLKSLKQHRLGNAWIVGGGVAVVADLVHSFLMPTLGLSAYEIQQLSGYETGQLAGVEGLGEVGLYSEGAYS